MATKICVFNPTSKLIDITDGVSIGPGTPGEIVVLNQNGVIDTTLLQLGTTALAGETVNPGNLVNLYNDAGVLKVQRAYAAGTGTAPSGAAYPVMAAGFVNDSIGTGNVVTISFTGIFNYTDTHGEFNSASIGKEVYLSPIDKGGITITRPAGVGQADQSVGYVLAFSNNVVTVLFIAAFNDFTQISGVAKITQGGTGASTPSGAIHNLFGQPPAGRFFAGVASGPVADPSFRAIVNSDLAGAAGGANKQIQFNQSGGFGGDSVFTWDYTAHKLFVDGTVVLGTPGDEDPTSHNFIFAEKTVTEAHPTYGVTGIECYFNWQPPQQGDPDISVSGAVFNSGVLGTFGVDQAIGMNTSVSHQSTGHSLEADATLANALIYHGTIDKVRAVEAIVSMIGDAAVTEAAAFHARISVPGGTGTIANAYGLLVDDVFGATVDSYAIKTGLGWNRFGDRVFPNKSIVYLAPGTESNEDPTSHNLIYAERVNTEQNPTYAASGIEVYYSWSPPSADGAVGIYGNAANLNFEVGGTHGIDSGYGMYTTCSHTTTGHSKYMAGTSAGVMLIHGTIDEAVGLDAEVRMVTNAVAGKAYGVRSIVGTSPGTMSEAYGVLVADVQGATSKNYAIKTGKGKAEFGDHVLFNQGVAADDPETGVILNKDATALTQWQIGYGSYLKFAPTANYADTNLYTSAMEFQNSFSGTHHFSGPMYGIDGYVTVTGSGNIGQVIGMEGSNFVSGAGIATDVIGMRGYSEVQGRTASKLIGSTSFIRNTGVGVVTNGIGSLIDLPVISGGGTITNLYGLKVEAVDGATGVVNGIKQNYAIHTSKGIVHLAGGVTEMFNTLLPADPYGLATQTTLTMDTSGAGHFTGFPVCHEGDIQFLGNGTIDFISHYATYPFNGGGSTAHVVQMNGFVAGFVGDMSGVTVDEYNAFLSDLNGAPGVVTNFYGLRIKDVTGGSVINRAIKTGLGKVEFGDDVILKTGVQILSGTGVPAVAAPNGSLFLRTDGAAGSTFYVREAGAWVAK